MIPRIVVISIGNELLSGRTLNHNLLFLGRELGKLGLSVRYAPAVRDDKDILLETLSSSIDNNDIIITTGGLGPTSDDITKQVIADYFNLRLITDENLWERIKNRFPNRYIPPINRKQAELPQGFSTLANHVGSAPGLYYETKGKLIILLPGVPNEMEHIFTEQVEPLLIKRYPLPSLTIKTVHTIDIPESSLAELISDIPCPTEIELAYLPQPGMVDLRITGYDEESVKIFFNQVVRKVDSHIWGIDDETLALKVHNLLTKERLTLSAAESCTGGMVQKILTELSGSSAYFLGGIVTYSNEAKINVLGVDEKIITEFGAVSEQTAYQMAKMVRERFGADFGISITGIAGPTGGTESKPVGTVCFGVATPQKTETFIKRFTGSRSIIRQKAAHYILYLLLKKRETEAD